MLIRWDEEKAGTNIKKHEGVTFDEASGVFFDPLAQHFEDSHPDGNRMIVLGIGTKDRLLLVVYAEYDGDVIRIISARKATKRERRTYEEGI